MNTIKERNTERCLVHAHMAPKTSCIHVPRPAEVQLCRIRQTVRSDDHRLNVSKSWTKNACKFRFDKIVLSEIIRRVFLKWHREFWTHCYSIINIKTSMHFPTNIFRVSSVMITVLFIFRCLFRLKLPKYVHFIILFITVNLFFSFYVLIFIERNIIKRNSFMITERKRIRFCLFYSTFLKII